MVLVALGIMSTALLLAMSATTSTTALCAEIPVIPKIPPAATVTTARMALSTAAAALPVAIVHRTLDGPLRRPIGHALRSTVYPSRFTAVPIIPGIPIVTAFRRPFGRAIIAAIPIIHTNVRTICNPVSATIGRTIRGAIYITLGTITDDPIPTIGTTLRSPIRSSIRTSITIVGTVHIAFFGTV
jgi:hypothetical protein